MPDASETEFLARNAVPPHTERNWAHLGVSPYHGRWHDLGVHPGPSRRCRIQAYVLDRDSRKGGALPASFKAAGELPTEDW